MRPHVELTFTLPFALCATIALAGCGAVDVSTASSTFPSSDAGAGRRDVVADGSSNRAPECPAVLPADGTACSVPVGTNCEYTCGDDRKPGIATCIANPSGSHGWDVRVAMSDCPSTAVGTGGAAGTCVTNPNLNAGACFASGAVAPATLSLYDGELTLECEQGAYYVYIHVKGYAGAGTYTASRLAGGSRALDRPEFDGDCAVVVAAAASPDAATGARVKGSFECPCVVESFVNGTSGDSIVRASGTFEVDVVTR